MPHFVDLILPLPLTSAFTYQLTQEQVSKAAIGKRAIVSFGKAHYYSGIIVKIHNTAPLNYEAKVVIEIPDEHPIVLREQLELWAWIAHYYMCANGEVMKAALPSGLKLESETMVQINELYEEDINHRLSNAEQATLNFMGTKPISIGALEKLSGKKNLLPVIHRLLQLEAVFIAEKIKRKYQPKSQRYVRLLIKNQGVDALEPIFNSLKRSAKQQALFLKLLDLSHFLLKDNPNQVSQLDLLKAVGCSPSVLKELAKKGIIEIYNKPITHIDNPPVSTIAPLSPLTIAQNKALNEIHQTFKTHAVTLLHGVTSSGKTEIYTHLISETIKQGKRALFMVPEIALTTQLCDRLQRVFGNRMIVYHSKLSDGERVNLWQRLVNDQNNICLILGVRSSIFLPIKSLGLIIIDEEHEPSFKQQDPAPRYHGKNVAIMLAKQHQANVLLGSATPSIESYYLAQQGKYGWVTLYERYAGMQLPKVSLISLIEARKNNSLQGPFSQELLKHINNTLQNGKQAMLFLNRRGYAPVLECPRCAWVPKCPRCDVSLTLHKDKRRLVCHYCGYEQNIPNNCPICQFQILQRQGYGTERIEEEIKSLLPLAHTARMDTDTTQNKKSCEQIIKDFEMGRSNLLIGTQMITKGLNFDRVRTVGILNADAIINMPDFRAHERAFQLMEQVAGRAGRKNETGEVYIQCSDIKNKIYRQVIDHNYLGMAEAQIEDRQKYNYPPFSRLIAVYLKGKYEDRIQNLSIHYANLLTQCFGNQRVLGPETPVIGRIKNFYIRKVLLKIDRNISPSEVRKSLKTIQQELQHLPDFKQSIFYYDVDPIG